LYKLLDQLYQGPFSLIVQCKDANQLEIIISKLEGQLTGTIIADDKKVSNYTIVIEALIKRWVRPFSFQNWPDYLLPDELKSKNPLGISRFVNGKQII